MNTSSSRPTRSSWLMLFAAFVNAVVLYGILLLFIVGPPDSAAPRSSIPPLAFSIAATACLFGSMLWTRLRLRPLVSTEFDSSPDAARPQPDPAQFQLHSLISIAFAETAAVIGFVQGFFNHTGIIQYLPFGVGTLAVMLFDVLPLGLRFWKQVESEPTRSSIE